MVNNNEDLSLDVMLRAFKNIAWLAKTTHMLSHSLNCFDSFSTDSDGKWSSWFEQKFTCFGGDSHEIDFEEFKKVLHIKEVKKYT